MIKTETITINDKTYYRTYSDSKVMIHGGYPEGDYAEAIDPVERDYTETDIPIEEESDDKVDYTDAGADRG